VLPPIDPARLSAGDPYAPELGNAGYDVQRYTLRVTLDPRAVAQSPGALSASATIAAVSTVDGLREIGLDFVGFSIESVRVGKADARSTRHGRKLLVELPQPLGAGTPFSVTVDYSGQPLAERSEFVPFIGHLGLQFVDETAYVVSEPDGARYWFPANDHPRDKAAFRFELTVPHGLTGVANGRLVATEPNLPDALGRGETGDRYIWEHDQPMATYQATIAVGRYERVDGASPGGVPLRSYVFPKRRADFERLMPAVGAAVDWLGERFGRYPFPEFGYVTVKGLGASLETQTMVVLDERSLDEATMVHELAHMWFGDWVSLDSWRDVWRNEGFATYAQMLWEARADPAALDRRLAPEIQRPPPSQYPIGDPPRGQLFAGETYNRGALLAHALRQASGDKAFYAGLREYFAKYGGGTASQADFQSALERAAGRPLQEIFDRWLL
jgi:aminopeptidase N